jgi:hypothetical protein
LPWWWPAPPLARAWTGPRSPCPATRTG